MKTKYLVAIAALAVLPFISSYGQAPGPAAANLSPAAAEVVRLAGAGTSEDVVLAYVQNSQTPFNLSADHVLYLKDLGVPSPVVAAMLTRDSALHVQGPPLVEAPPPQAAPVPMAAPGQAPPGPPPVQVSVTTPPPDVGYFYNDLSPYGAWVDLPGSGWCWQPSVCATMPGWQPYLHGGHWMNTDAGWFWSSDYSWGWAPFHYGRWHLHPTAGWVWFPGREWGPAWVVWRSGGDHCGWAPLPPHADFIAGVGWRYNGVHVSASFDFGLSVGCFSFVSLGHFGDRDLHSYCLPRTQVTQIYNTTTVINNVTYVNNTYVNRGISVNVFEKAGGHRFETVKVGDAHSGVAMGGGAYRHPLPPLVPVQHYSAVKMDKLGHIPSNLSSSSRISGAGLTRVDDKGKGNNGQSGQVKPLSLKASGATQDFNKEKFDGKARPGTTPPASSKFTTTTGGNNNSSGANNGQSGNAKVSNLKATGATHDFTVDKLDGKARPGSTPPPSTKFTTTSGTPVTGGNKSGAGGSTGGGASGSGSNVKLYDYQAPPGKVQASPTTPTRQLRSEDLRGASSLTAHDNKFNNSSVSGISQKNNPGNSGGSSTIINNASHVGSNPNLSRSTGGSSSSSSGAKGSSGSGYNKDNNSTSGAGSGGNR